MMGIAKRDLILPKLKRRHYSYQFGTCDSFLLSSPQAQLILGKKEVTMDIRLFTVRNKVTKLYCNSVAKIVQTCCQ